MSRDDWGDILWVPEPGQDSDRVPLLFSLLILLLGIVLGSLWGVLWMGIGR